MDRVVKPLKKAISDTIKKKSEKKDTFTQLNVVDADGNVLKVFRKSEYGDRFVFKATQYAQNYSTMDNPLTVE